MSIWFNEINRLLDGWAPSLAVLVGAVLLGWLAKAVFFRRLRKLAERTRTRADDVLLAATGSLWFPFVVLLGLYTVLGMAPHLEDVLRSRLEHVVAFLLLVTLTLAGSRFVGRWFALAEPASSGEPAQPSLVAKATRIGVVLFGLIWAIQSAGFEITPLLTALGIGSLAIGLALQPTLSNFFAGIHLSMSKPIRIGDFIELEDGTQGEVIDISWRTTKLRQLANNLVIVPNARISDMRLLNYSMPEHPQSVVIAMGVAYDSDLRRVEEICIEVAHAVIGENTEIADSTFEPLVRFHTFGDSSINFNVILRSRAMTDRFVLVHSFVKRIKERFDAEGIEIPFPQRVVHLPDRTPVPERTPSD